MNIIGEFNTKDQAKNFLEALVLRFSATPTTDVDLKTIMKIWIRQLYETKNLNDVDSYVLKKLVDIEETIDIFHKILRLILSEGDE